MSRIVQNDSPLRTIMLTATDGCCGDAPSRFYLCDYHSGYQDALEDWCSDFIPDL